MTQTKQMDYNVAEVAHHILWRNPGLLIELYKELLRNRTELMIQRLGDCPIPIRIHVPIETPQSLKTLSNRLKVGEKLTVAIEKESTFHMYVYGDKTTGEEHIVIAKNLGNRKNVPVRVHSSCVTAETFHASNCDCHEQLEKALEIIDKEDFGLVIWLHQEGRGNGLAAKTQQLRIMLAEGTDTVSAFEKAGYPRDQRDYSVAADILKDLGITSIRLITNNPDKVGQLSELGIKVNGRISCIIAPINEIVRRDLKAKKEKLGHFFGESV